MSERMFFPSNEDDEEAYRGLAELEVMQEPPTLAQLKEAEKKAKAARISFQIDDEVEVQEQEKRAKICKKKGGHVWGEVEVPGRTVPKFCCLACGKPHYGGW